MGVIITSVRPLGWRHPSRFLALSDGKTTTQAISKSASWPMDFHRTRQGRNRKRDLYTCTDSDVSNLMALMLPSVHFPCNFIVLFLLSSLTFFLSLLYSALSLLFHIYISLSPLSVFFFSIVFIVSLFFSLSLSPPLYL